MTAPRLLTAASSEDPVADMALTHALLRGTAAGAGPVLRVFRPGATMAFGRRDVLRDGFPAAVAAARRHGFVPVLRSAGGHAAAYDAGSVVVERTTPIDEIATGIEPRFAAAADELVAVLRARDVDARVGMLPGEYCPGAHSVHLGGRVKVAGIAQRVVRGAALVTAVLVVEGGGRVRAAIADVYAALGIAIDPAVTGGVDDVAAGLSPERVAADLAAALAPGAEPDAPTPAELEAARALRGRHAIA